MKKILFITSLYYPHVGGIETMVTELSSFYRKNGLEVVCLTKKWPETLSSYERYNETDIYRVISARTEQEFRDLVAWAKDNESKIKSDIIHVIGVRRPLPLLGLLLARKWKVPLVCTIAGGDISDKSDPQPTKVWEEGIGFIPEVLMQADSVNCVSGALANDLKVLVPGLKDIGVLYAGLDISTIKSIAKEQIKDQYIFSLRRLDPSKGVNLLIEAFSLIKDKFPKLYLIIAGEGEEEQNLRQLVEDRQVSDRTLFIGTVALERGMALLKGADVTVVPSISEGGGLINIEAQAAGCPVIASRVGGIPEYVKENKSGFLFESGNFTELAEKISDVLSNKSLRAKIIKGGYEYSQSFDWDVLVPQYVNLYKTLIDTYQVDKQFKPWSPLTRMLQSELE